MITTLVTARSESNKLNSARSAQGWQPVDSLSQSSELASRLAKPFPFAGEWRLANRAPVGGSIGASLTLIDLVAVASLFLTTAFFFPAMAWLLLLS
jgi:hypothetical protein